MCSDLSSNTSMPEQCRMKETINFGVIGCGSISATHLAALAEMKDVRVVAVSDANASRRTNAAAKTGARAYADYHELLADPDVDIVTILTASGAHAAVGMEAARAGKHVVVEKPLDVTVENAQALIDCCREKGVTLSCIFQHRFDPAVRILKDAVTSGRMGRINACCCHTKWYRDQNYYDCANWRGTLKFDGGGALINQSIHYIDTMLYIMGDAEEVFGYTATLAHERIEGEDVAMATVKFRSGALGLIEGTTSAYPGFYARLDVHGERGSVIIEDDVIKFWSMADGTPCPQVPALNSTPHAAQLRDIVDAVRYGAAPAVTGEEALKSLALVRAVYASARSGAPTRL